ncbi:MAG: hypothetical protein R2867_10685 [Caldilineaceae bacterium]
MSPKEVSAEWTMNILLVEDDEVDAEALLRIPQTPRYCALDRCEKWVGSTDAFAH